MRGSLDEGLIAGWLLAMFPQVPLLALDFAKLPVAEQLVVASRTAVIITPLGGSCLGTAHSPGCQHSDVLPQ